MRIIAGKLGGRQFETPKSHKTHPMSEKMRGALFNILGDIGSLTVFDAYGGSGALAFEAISRGAKQVTVCEIDKNAVKVIQRNIKNLGLSNEVMLIKQSSATWAEGNGGQFDLVLCDPPYDAVKHQQIVIISQTVTTGGLLVLSLPPTNERYVFSDFKLEADKNYGDSSLVFYRKIC
jgi:16S rRNA (guanine966-N2)-methyltransferase